MAAGLLPKRRWTHQVRRNRVLSVNHIIDTPSRLGSLLMDLDAFSGVIANRHTGDGVSTVTAACDRITIENPLMEICDLELSGQCTYATGRSSMEISLQVTKARPEGVEAKPEDVLITCAFTMVSLDTKTKKYVTCRLIARVV